MCVGEREMQMLGDSSPLGVIWKQLPEGQSAARIAADTHTHTHSHIYSGGQKFLDASGIGDVLICTKDPF